MCSAMAVSGDVVQSRPEERDVTVTNDGRRQATSSLEILVFVTPASLDFDH
jgi:hypothetical protein